MADPTLTNSATGSSAVATTNAAFGFTATAGRLIVLCVQADDYKTGNPTGYTASTNTQFSTGFQGGYVWWKVAAGGETSASYTIGSASRSDWLVAEFDSIDPSPYDISDGSDTNTGADSRTTPTIVPSTGRRFLIAVVMGQTTTDDFSGIGTWLNSFTEAVEALNNGGNPRQAMAIATLAVDGNGATGFSSGATYTSTRNPATLWNAGVTMAFKVAAGGSGGSATIAWRRA